MRWRIGLLGVALLTLSLTACESTPAPAARQPAAVGTVDSGDRSAPGPTLGGLLAELEQNLQPAGVAPVWSARRADWGEEARGAERPRRVAALLAELEDHVRWSASSAEWKARRPDWSEELGAANTTWGVAICLAELEANIDRGALAAHWLLRRPRWIDDLRRAVGLQPTGQLLRQPRAEQRGALWVVRNRTRERLTLRWSGPMQGLRQILPGGEVSIPLIPGTYVVRAKTPNGEAQVLVRELEARFRYTETFSSKR